MFKTVLTFCLTAIVTLAMAQVKTPQPSPMSKIEQTVGLSTISLEYSRPGVKDRVIFGDLVPYDKMWRTGANKNTMITLSDDMNIGGEDVKAGTYALFTKPGKQSWEVYFYADTENWGTPEEWDAAKVAAKVMTKPMLVNDKIENFLITFDNLRDDSADLIIGWDKVMLSLPIKLETQTMVMESIDKTMNGPSGRDLYNAARYYRENGKDLNKALVWMKQAVAKQGDKFWNLRQLALIQADLGMKKDAIKTAEKSLALAKEAGYDVYVKSNEESIKEWSKK